MARFRIAWLAILLALIFSLPEDADARRRRRRRKKRRKKAHPAAVAFKKATKLFKQRDYVGALEAFEQAYRLRPHFLVQCNMARCHERLTDMIKAAEHYRRCLREGAKRKRRSAKRVRAALKHVQSRITWVLVNSKDGGTIYVDGKRMGDTPLRVPLNPGNRSVEVRKDGATPARTTIATRGGEMRTIELNPVPLAPEPVQKPRPPPKKKIEEVESEGLHQAWFWTGVAVTAGLTAVATVLGVLALRSKSAFEGDPTRDGYNDAKNKRLLANVFIGAATLAGAGSTVLFFFTDFGGGGRRESSDDDDEDEVAFGVGIAGTF